MIKDISIIRKELDGYEEVEIPFNFERGCNIKYITLKDDDESFYLGGEFKNIGNDCIILKNNNKTWSVPLVKRNKDGSIKYQSRFFIKDKEKEDCNTQIKELNDIISYQQNIINTMSEKLKDLEITRVQIANEKRDYEELLQQNRYNYKNICIQSSEKDEKIKKYEEIITKLTNSHSIFK
jgi:hypothetical protein